MERGAYGDGCPPRANHFLTIAQDRPRASHRDGEQRHASLCRDEERTDLEWTKTGCAPKGAFGIDDKTLTSTDGVDCDRCILNAPFRVFALRKQRAQASKKNGKEGVPIELLFRKKDKARWQNSGEDKGIQIA